MRIEQEARGRHTVIRMMGMVTASDGSTALSEALATAEARAGSVVIDASELRHMDSTALGVLVGSMRRLHTENREICFVKPGPRIVLLLELTHLDALFPTYATVADAVAAMERRPILETGGTPLADRDRHDV